MCSYASTSACHCTFTQIHVRMHVHVHSWSANFFVRSSPKFLTCKLKPGIYSGEAISNCANSTESLNATVSRKIFFGSEKYVLKNLNAADWLNAIWNTCYSKVFRDQKHDWSILKTERHSEWSTAINESVTRKFCNNKKPTDQTFWQHNIHWKTECERQCISHGRFLWSAPMFTKCSDRAFSKNKLNTIKTHLNNDLPY